MGEKNYEQIKRMSKKDQKSWLFSEGDARGIVVDRTEVMEGRERWPGAV